MAEQYANLPSTTVAVGGYTSGSGVLNVASTAAPFPQNPTFRVSILNPSTKAVKVVLRVTAINSSTQWAVTAEGTDASAAASDEVVATVTAGALDQIRIDQCRVLTLSQFDALASHEYREGDRIILSDSPYQAVRSSSDWLYFWRGQRVYRPDTSGWSWVNQDAATISIAGGVLFLDSGNGSGGFEVNARVATSPASPYTVEALVIPFLNSAGGFADCGLLLRQSGNGALAFFGITRNSASAQLTTSAASSPTSFTSGSNPAINVDAAHLQPTWMRLEYNSGSSFRRRHVSVDGVNWVQLQSEAHNAYSVTPDQYGFYVNSNSSGAVVRVAIVSLRVF